MKTNHKQAVAPGWYLLQVALIAVSAISAVLLWDQIPNKLAVHYNITFQPDRYAAKGFGPVFMFNIVQLFLLAIMMGADYVVKHATQHARPEMTNEKSWQFRYANSVFLYGLSLLLVLYFSYVQATTLYGWPRVLLLIGTIALFVLIIGGLAFLIIYIRRLRLTQHLDGDLGEEGRWMAGGIYYNPQDPSIFVPKKYGIGWTLNFGRPTSWLVIATLFAIPFLIAGVVALME
ncbi:DUF5808 domain-containing protein [Paenibacillus sp. CF384]|uniref:DUF5808 domain-containing protein n=1 Tax=Paenibacillus sp. CF384 TaxID=1884382 RepID=UPI000896039E|nr:DUF5808 domain-containing protein [Paenibacillus sp. CF384]SDW69618.1 Protein of unknown function [Paenibacillus sp. CF384]